MIHFSRPPLTLRGASATAATTPQCTTPPPRPPPATTPTNSSPSTTFRSTLNTSQTAGRSGGQGQDTGQNSWCRTARYSGETRVSPQNMPKNKIVSFLGEADGVRGCVGTVPAPPGDRGRLPHPLLLAAPNDDGCVAWKLNQLLISHIFKRPNLNS